jgi:hypothetical protein
MHFSIRKEPEAHHCHCSHRPLFPREGAVCVTAAEGQVRNTPSCTTFPNRINGRGCCMQLRCMLRQQAHPFAV